MMEVQSESKPKTFTVDLTGRQIWWGIHVFPARGHQHGYERLDVNGYADWKDRPWRSRAGERANRDTDERE